MIVNFEEVLWPDGQTWHKATAINNGIGNVAFVQMVVTEIDELINEIFENYTGISIETNRDKEGNLDRLPDSWILGARSGLEYAISFTKKYWRVKIEGINGTIVDTNASIVGYCIIRTFLQLTAFKLTDDMLSSLEGFVGESTRIFDEELIPDFRNLVFTKI